MSNGNDKVFARLWKLWAMICKMIMDGKRDARVVANILQRIVDGIPDAFSRIWKTIDIGTGSQTRQGLLARLTQTRYHAEGRADQFIASPDFVVSSVRQEIHLVRLTVEQLGFSKRTSYGIICQRAQELGLGLCPCDVAPQLLLQYENQPIDDYFFIASKPIVCLDGYARILGLYRDKERQVLEGFHAHSLKPSEGFDPNHEFVFVKP